MRLIAINKETGNIDKSMDCAYVGYIGAMKAVRAFGGADNCNKLKVKPWEIVYYIEYGFDKVILSTERYILTF